MTSAHTPWCAKQGHRPDRQPPPASFPRPRPQARAESDGGSSDDSGSEDAGRRCRALAALPAPGTAALALPTAAPGQLSRQTAADLVRNLLSLPFDRRAELCCDILVGHEPSRKTVESWTLAHTEQHLGGCEDMEMR